MCADWDAEARAEQAAVAEEEGTVSAHAAQQGQTAYVPCPDCAGSGIDSMDGSMYCSLCDGNGTVAPAVAASVSTEYGV